MFSKKCQIELTFHYFYIVFDYSWFLEIQLNWYKLFLSIRSFICQVLLFEVSKISFKIFVQAFFCSLLTCVYHIYWISVYWSWNLSLGVLENLQWNLSKQGIQIHLPCRFVEGCDKGANFYDFTCCH